MPRFFIDNGLELNEKQIFIKGEDAHHISRVLRMKENDEIILCDGGGNDYICRIKCINKSEKIVDCTVLNIVKTKTESNIDISLYMGLPKSDKMDFIIQKAVELGTKKIVPFVAKRSVARPFDNNNEIKKYNRWKKIAREAAMQSERGVIPNICEIMSFDDAVLDACKSDISLFLYEKEKNLNIKDVFSDDKIKSVSIMIGPEGGFEEYEANKAISVNMKSVSLGNRILRCETAPLVAISIVMYQYGGF